MANDEQIDYMLTVREVARLLHVHPNTLRRWSNKGRIRAYRISPQGDRRFKREEIARFLAELNIQQRQLERSLEQIVATVINETSHP